MTFAYRVLRHDEGAASRDVSWVLKTGGGMLFAVIFFGILCLVGFAACQICKNVKCCERRNNRKAYNELAN